MRSTDRLLQMVQTVFLTRDTIAAIEGDTETKAGALPRASRFSPFIRDVGNTELAREILRKIAGLWPDHPHHAVHYTRHLLYEAPTDVDLAIKVATAAGQTEKGSEDDAVAHTIGMCYRIKMENVLQNAKETGAGFDGVEGEVRRHYESAIEYFDLSITHADARSEYGRVATIQTVSKLLRNALEVSGEPHLARFLRGSSRTWCAAAITRAEQHIEALQNMPSISSRAQRTIIEWDLVYGNIEVVVAQLRQLAKRNPDPELRSAFCSALLARYKRAWSSIPQGDLQTIARFSEQNIEGRGATDFDVRTWFRAYRYLSSFDSLVAIRRLSDWHQLRPTGYEAPFYLYVLYFINWLNTKRTNRSFGEESTKWIDVCAQNRPRGFRSWGYEWLAPAKTQFKSTHFSDLDFDPVAVITGAAAHQRKKLELLSRIEGTITRYKGPQQADLDLGHGVLLRFTPLDKITKDDEGKKASVYVSFGYDGIRGWDPALSTSTGSV
jgi:hypothetical protein